MQGEGDLREGELESSPNSYPTGADWKSGGKTQSVPVKSRSGISHSADFSGMGDQLDSIRVKSNLFLVAP